MSCDLNTLVTLGICPDDGTNLSGFTLLQAGGMNIRSFAEIATDSSGIDMVMEKKALAINKLKNDLLGALAMANVNTSIAQPIYESGYFKPATSVGASSSGRGTVIHKAKWHGNMRQTLIKAVEVYPLTDGTGTLQIQDGSNIYSWPITLVANSANYYNETQLDGFPFSIRSKTAKVLVIANGVSFASSYIQCKTGCHGAPNPCGWADGWNGTGYVKDEGYGTNIYFQCVCDYTQLICSNPALFGELLWLQWQMLIFDEQYKSNRFTNWVTYNQKTINEVVMPDLSSQYQSKWNTVTGNLPNILRTFNDQCLDCRDIKWVTNI
jgi:hypothetical protein